MSFVTIGITQLMYITKEPKMLSNIRSSLNPKLTLNLVFRDSVQNLIVPTVAKVAFAKQAMRAGVVEFEFGSFTKLPSMRDSKEVFQEIRRIEGCTLTALVPNQKGFEQAKKEGVRSISFTGAVSSAFLRKNIRMNFENNYSQIKKMAAEAKVKGIATKIYVSCCFGCEFEGKMPLDEVTKKIKWYREICDEIVVCDSTGEATPEKVKRLFSSFSHEIGSSFSVHFHGPRALENTRTAIRQGVTKVDVGVKGLGGCTALTSPKANLPMVDLLNWSTMNRYETGIDYFAYKFAERELINSLKKELPASLGY